jgi:hypothetical protein
LNLNQIDSSVRFETPEQPKGKRIHGLSIGWSLLYLRNNCKSSLEESGQKMCPDTFHEQGLMFFQALLICPSGLESILHAISCESELMPSLFTTGTATGHCPSSVLESQITADASKERIAPSFYDAEDRDGRPPTVAALCCPTENGVPAIDEGC